MTETERVEANARTALGLAERLSRQAQASAAYAATSHPAGSAGKVAVMAERAKLRPPLFHPDDA